MAASVPAPVTNGTNGVTNGTNGHSASSSSGQVPAPGTKDSRGESKDSKGTKRSSRKEDETEEERRARRIQEKKLTEERKKRGVNYSGPRLMALTPGRDMHFDLHSSEPHEQKVVLTNVCDDPIVFKIKTTVPRVYLIRPSNEILPVGRYIEISFMLQPGM